MLTKEKIIFLMILVFLFGHTKAQYVATDINFDGYHPDANGTLVLTQEQLDDIHYISPTIDDLKVVGFKVSATIKGFARDAVSITGEINKSQRDIINQTAVGDKIYFEDILLKNLTTGNFQREKMRVVIKDGICADVIGYGGTKTKICVFTSLKSPFSDTIRYSVKSYKVVTTSPQYAFCSTFQGNNIDSIVKSVLMDNGFDNIIDVVCIDNETHEEFTLDHVQKYNSERGNKTYGLYRSKEYFTKKNAKLDFVYKQDFKIDSVKVEFYNSVTNKTDEYTFKGDVFDETFKRYIKNSVPCYSWITLYVYHSGEEEKIPIYIVE